ncbi:ADP-ribosylglycohydrolase family protein [Myxococcota bacterium]|nr:ADP-ribosylglycohydrolase family protein [Myxococcota bacterium]
MTDLRARARGCLLGQFAGDSLGGLVEFRGPDSIRRAYPDGVRDLADGGTFNNIAGQVTDDSEMALAMARSVVRLGRYDVEAVREAYVRWMNSGPFDIGGTTRRGLSGAPDHRSQANGALMRASPLGIIGAGMGADAAASLAADDAMITHPNPICVQVNRLFVTAIADAVAKGLTPAGVYDRIVARAQKDGVDQSVMQTILDAATDRPRDYLTNAGWVLVAFQNALWQLLHAPNLEEGIVDSIMQGGDTDTNACICGALLGAVHGDVQVPARWVAAIESCRPEPGRPGVHHPRPAEYWPNDVLSLADALVALSPAAR